MRNKCCPCPTSEFCGDFTAAREEGRETSPLCMYSASARVPPNVQTATAPAPSAALAAPESLIDPLDQPKPFRRQSSSRQERELTQPPFPKDRCRTRVRKRAHA